MIRFFPDFGTDSYNLQVFVTTLSRGICLFLMIPALYEIADRGYRSSILFSIAGVSIVVFLLTTVLSRASYDRFEGLLVFNSFALLAAAGTLGIWLSREVQKAGHLLPLCLIAAGVDIISVSRGPTGDLVRQIETHTQYLIAGIPHHPPWATYLLLHYPQPGGGLEIMIGAGDLAFFGLLAGSIAKFGFGKYNIPLLALWGFTAVITSIFLRAGIPALPFIGFGFIIVNVRFWKLDRNEWIITAVFVIVLLLIALHLKVGLF